jgi:hypothetical protein
MELVKDGPLERGRTPLSIGPGKCRRIDHPRRAVHAVRLKARDRIGKDLIIASVQTITVERAGWKIGERS